MIRALAALRRRAARAALARPPIEARPGPTRVTFQV